MKAMSEPRKKRQYKRKSKGVPPVTEPEAGVNGNEPDAGADPVDNEPAPPADPEAGVNDPIREDLPVGMINMGSVVPTVGSLPDPAPGETKEPGIVMSKVQPRKFRVSPSRAKSAPLPVLTLSQLRSLRKA
jgi:hypothetical protein